MKTHSADANRIYYIEDAKIVNDILVELLLTEPYSFKDEYGCVVFKGIFVINRENIPFLIDSGLKDIRFFSASNNAVFLLENKNEIINSFIKSFRKFYKNRVNSIYQKEIRGKLLKI